MPGSSGGEVALERESALGRGFMPQLRCPRCGGELRPAEASLDCGGACASRFPVRDGVPILIDDESSVFSIQTFLDRDDTFFRAKKSLLARAADRATPRLVLPAGSAEHLRSLREALRERDVERPVILVVGGSIVGDGMQALIDDPTVDLIETDVAWGPRTQLICDAHDLPIADGAVDAVVVQAVLEHVIDPFRCVAEIHRVLKPEGLVYAEVPFMQPVHGGAYDFMRFSHSGIRVLFRQFAEVDSGAVSGPGGAFGYSLTYLLLGFSRPGSLRKVVGRLARLLACPFKHFDRLLVGRPAALDGACAVYFLGRRSDELRSAAEIVAAYEGGL